MGHGAERVPVGGMGTRWRPSDLDWGMRAWSTASGPCCSAVASRGWRRWRQPSASTL